MAFIGYVLEGHFLASTIDYERFILATTESLPDVSLIYLFLYQHYLFDLIFISVYNSLFEQFWFLIN